MYHLNTVCTLGLLNLYVVVHSVELPIPEHRLEPRNFNHHPYTVLPQLLLEDFDHPYAALSFKLSGAKGRQNTHDINHVSQFGNLDDYVRRLLGTRMATPRNYSVSKKVENGRQKSSHAYSLEKIEQPCENHGSSTRGQYKVSLPEERLRIVNYIADDDGYRADVSYEQEHNHRHHYYYQDQDQDRHHYQKQEQLKEKPIVENVEDLPAEVDVHTRIALQSANLAKIQSDLVNIPRRGHVDQKPARSYQSDVSAPGSASFSTLYEGILLSSLLPTRTTYELTNAATINNEIISSSSDRSRSDYLYDDSASTRGPVYTYRVSKDCDYLNYNSYDYLLHYPCWL
ncbi:uncharacterized protein LOC112494656 [Cephus cinctus]|uniref:Uncharacterized protein LOC112494656 n=1 Tax=Cephus cinctus TaxID=211228 RepID=A0AAJ7RMB1_CEPCN|nr:uncharacterized protein LOC112494656 [Cephus cinctus]